MTSLNDALRNIEQDGGEIRFQMLDQCTIKAQDKKRTKDTDITFHTNQTTTNNIMGGTGKVGIVVWVDRGAWCEQLTKANSTTDDKIDSVTYTHEQLWDAVCVILPNIGLARGAGASFNLPTTLQMVGADYFVHSDEEREQFSKEKIDAYELCRVALVDLKRDGHFNYSNQGWG